MRSRLHSPKQWCFATCALTVVLGLAAAVDGCASRSAIPAKDSGADFAAHRGWTGLVIDQMDHGDSGVLVQAKASTFPSGPSHLLEVSGKPVAALWIFGRNWLGVRQTPQPSEPLLGEVRATWDSNTSGLSFRLANGRSFHTTAFTRRDGESAPSRLDSQPFAVFDLPGTYFAQILDNHDNEVGWLRVHILPYQGLPRDYEGAFPAPLNGALAAGAVQLVDAQIDAMVARNVFPGDRAPEGLVP